MKSPGTPDKTDITKLLIRLSNGEEEVIQTLYPMVYNQLRIIAQNQLSFERGDHTLNKTDLVHETYLKLLNVSDINWQSRGHFYAIAAKAMRQVLTDHARKKLAQKRGNRASHLPLEEKIVNLNKQASDLIDIDEALTELSEVNDRLCKIVELRFYTGLSIEEIGEILGISKSTIYRDWLKARAWLNERLQYG